MRNAWLLPFGVMSLSCAALAGLSDVPNPIDAGQDAFRADGSVRQRDTGTKSDHGSGTGAGAESGPDTGGDMRPDTGADGHGGTGSGTGQITPPPPEAGTDGSAQDADDDSGIVWVTSAGADASAIDMCESSCGNDSSPGDTFLNALFHCVCVTGGKCATNCAKTLCAYVEPFSDDPCSKCIAQMDESCATMAGSSCAADSNCATWLNCIEGCEGD